MGKLFLTSDLIPQNFSAMYQLLTLKLAIHSYYKLCTVGKEELKKSGKCLFFIRAAVCQRLKKKKISIFSVLLSIQNR